VKDYPTDKLRNIALIGHGTSGKTSLAEALLYSMKSISRLGTVDAGNTTMDYAAGEHKRKISIHLGTAYGEWRDCKMNLFDAPGYDDFTGEVASALRVADCALLVVNGVAGVEAGAERTFQMARERNMPTMVCVNMMDKEHADFDGTIAQAQELLSEKIVPLQLPIGSGPDFKGLIDLFQMKAYIYSDAGHEPSEADIPAEYADRAAKAREALIEAVAEFDDNVIEKYLEGQELTRDEIFNALRTGVASGGAYPAMVASATRNFGTRRLLDTLAVCFPSPADLPPFPATLGDDSVELTADPDGPAAALVFKTVVEPHLGELSLFRVYSGTLTSGAEAQNVSRNSSEKLGQLYVLIGNQRAEVARIPAGDVGAAVKLRATHTGDTLALKAKPYLLPRVDFPAPVTTEAIVPKNKGDEDKIGVALHKIMEEDPTVNLEVDPELHQQLLYGMGELHLEVVLDKLREKHVEVELKKPRIHFRETITRPAQGQGRYKKQTGGRGQYGDVWLKLEPRGRAEGFEFADEIVGGVVPNKFIPAVEKGVKEAMTEGTVAGYPVVDVRITLYDGSYHTVDSSEMAFKVAGSMAFKKLMPEAGPVLLEPIMEVEVQVPDDFTGDVMGDLSSRRGRILGMSPQGSGQLVRALVPAAEMYHYHAQLRSMTQGRGRFSMKFNNYEEIPRDQADRIIDAAKAAREETEGS
jgi:elongation factor G